MKKITIHNLDDVSEQAKWVEEALCPRQDDKIYHEKARINFTNMWFDYKRFSTVGSAIEYYEKVDEYPDIAVIDLDLRELQNSSISKQEKSSTRGFALYRYLSDKAPFCLKIIFSGQLGIDEIVEHMKLEQIRLNDQFVFGKPRNERNEIAYQDKANPFGLEKSLPNLLRLVAEKYFQQLTSEQRFLLKDLLECNDDQVIQNFECSFGSQTFQLKYLLLNPSRQPYFLNIVRIGYFGILKDCLAILPLKLI